jgi:hypothetical protein
MMSGKSGSAHYKRALGWNTVTMYRELGEVTWDVSSFERGISEEFSNFLSNLPEFSAPVVVGDCTVSCGV